MCRLVLLPMLIVNNFMLFYIDVIIICVIKCLLYMLRIICYVLFYCYVSCIPSRSVTISFTFNPSGIPSSSNEKLAIWDLLDVYWLENNSQFFCVQHKIKQLIIQKNTMIPCIVICFAFVCLRQNWMT